MRLYSFKKFVIWPPHNLSWTVHFSRSLKLFKWHPRIPLALCSFRPPFLGLLFSGACDFPHYWSTISDIFVVVLKHSAFSPPASLRTDDLSSYSPRKMKWSDENFQTSTTTLSTIKLLPPKLKLTTPWCYSMSNIFLLAIQQFSLPSFSHHGFSPH